MTSHQKKLVHFLSTDYFKRIVSFQEQIKSSPDYDVSQKEEYKIQMNRCLFLLEAGRKNQALPFVLKNDSPDIQVEDG